MGATATSWPRHIKTAEPCKHEHARAGSKSPHLRIILEVAAENWLEVGHSTYWSPSNLYSSMLVRRKIAGAELHQRDGQTGGTLPGKLWALRWTAFPLLDRG